MLLPKSLIWYGFKENLIKTKKRPVSASQAEGRGFEPRFPLLISKYCLQHRKRYICKITP